jgi:uncharacterized membrane protein
MKLLFSPLDFQDIERAIALAESRTSGEIRVVVYPHAVTDVLVTAREEFARLGMHRTRHRNAVLILVAPETKAYAIFGDEAVHARCGDGFWVATAGAMAAHFRRGRFSEGVVHGIREAGAILAHHFPAGPQDRNELPDDVVERGIVI